MSGMRHPCSGMTRAQVEAFERVAINQPPACRWDTIDALLKAGVIERGPGETRRDAIGVYEIPSFYVPTHIHVQWCEWASEQPDLHFPTSSQPDGE